MCLYSFLKPESALYVPHRDEIQVACPLYCGLQIHRALAPTFRALLLVQAKRCGAFIGVLAREHFCHNVLKGGRCCHLREAPLVVLAEGEGETGRDGGQKERYADRGRTRARARESER